LPIEIRNEARGRTDPPYETRRFDEHGADHRKFVGGMWDELGAKQLEFVREQGLRPDQKFLDVGCGALRAGRLIAAYLDPGNYYGIDINHDLLTIGYERELDDETRARLPEANLRATDRFDADFGVRFDMAIAQSVFTHLGLNWIRLCLYRVAASMAPGGRFYATFFEESEDFPVDGISASKNGRFTERNRYWYYPSDLEWAAERTPFQFRYIGRWQHPKGQRMVEYTRLPD
jgi:SAM-dependent methyltransferase